jgi:hypothetical protein
MSRKKPHNHSDARNHVGIAINVLTETTTTTKNLIEP